MPGPLSRAEACGGGLGRDGRASRAHGVGQVLLLERQQLLVVEGERRVGGARAALRAPGAANPGALRSVTCGALTRRAR
jgi:hypothetical protein